MPHHPRLITVRAPRRAQAAVVVAHGGASRRGNPMVSPTQLSVLRMVPVARRIAAAGGGRLAVYRLLNSTRGWDAEHTPVDDVYWALDRIGAGDGLPVGLVGHSLGGRAVLMAGHHPGVRAVVAMNPFVYPSDTPKLAGRRVLFVHGDDDRIAPAQRSAVVARRVLAETDGGYVTLRGGRHAMLRHGRTFERIAADYLAASLTDVEPRSGWTDPVTQVLAGRTWVEV